MSWSRKNANAPHGMVHPSQPELPMRQVLFATVAAAFSFPSPVMSAALPRGASVVLSHPEDEGDTRVGTYVSSSWGFSTRSYWIEGPSGLILIDAQFLPSAAEEFVNWAERTTGKKARLAIVLHANPDKFNGTGVFQKRGIKVVTSQQVRDAIPAIHEKRTRAFAARYAPDYPTTLALPDSFGDVTTQLQAAGLTVKAHVLGGGVSQAHVVVEWEGHVFVGDLVANGTHSWLELGLTPAWLDRLEEIRALEPANVHPGRGASGDARLLTEQARYLRDVMDTVAAQHPTLPRNDAALATVKQTLEARYPAHRFAIFLDIGLPAEWARQAAAPSPPLAGPGSTR
jgi:glyoxylase-like metal-dependent hydrolase (beta-lactamase superfamily II)